MSRQKRALIALGGEQPSLPLILREAELADIVIAADSGAQMLFNAGITPHLIVGDMDSIDKRSLAAFQNNGGRQLVVPCEKDDTDGALAAQEAKKAGAESVVILGGGGGRPDHMLGNLAVLLWLFKRGISAELKDDRGRAFFASGRVTLEPRCGASFSVLPYLGSVTCNLQEGSIKYPLSNLLLREDATTGLSNIALSDSITLDISGKALIYIAEQ